MSEKFGPKRTKFYPYIRRLSQPFLKIYHFESMGWKSPSGITISRFETKLDQNTLMNLIFFHLYLLVERQNFKLYGETGANNKYI
jgi:hypothetical protein